MFTTKLYKDKNGDMVAVISENGVYYNYIVCPEMVALNADSFIEDARAGFEDAISYEYDSVVGLTMEEAARQTENEGILIAQIDEQVVLYPGRMTDEQKDLFEMELGQDTWQEILKKGSVDEGVLIDI